MRDMKTNIDPVLAVAPAVQDATKADCPIVDLQGADSATVVLNTGAIVGSGLFVASLSAGDAANLADAAAVEAADLIGEFPAGLAANSAYTVGYTGGKRYVRVVLTKTSGTSIAVGGVIVKGHLNIAPAV